MKSLNLWRNKVLNFKATEVLNKEQESFIDYLLIIIKPDLFVADSKSSIEFRSATGKYISEKAKDWFGFEVAKNLIASINSTKKDSVSPNYVAPEDEGGIRKCQCSSISNYCDPLTPCDVKAEWICKSTVKGWVHFGGLIVMAYADQYNGNQFSLRNFVENTPCVWSNT